MRPGELAFRFPNAVSAPALVKRLEQLGWWAQVTGPHGSGKSTLLRTLLPLLEQEQRHIRMIALSAGQRRLSRPSAEFRRWVPTTLVIVDGFQQLNAWHRFRLRQACRRRATGLLVTAHDDAGFPTLFETRVTPELARALVADLLADSPSPVTIVSQEVDAALSRNMGNFREALFDLYDLYEQRRRVHGQGGKEV